MPNLNVYVSEYDRDDPTYAPYQPECGLKLWFEYEQTSSWPADTSVIDLVLSRMTVDVWSFPDHLGESPQKTPLTISALERALPVSYGLWKRCVVEFDGQRLVTATFWANFQRTTKIRAVPLTGLQGRALDLIDRIRPEDFEAVTGWTPPGVVELAISLASSAAWRAEHDVNLCGIMVELENATRHRGFTDSELETAQALAATWTQEADELVEAVRSLEGPD